MAGIGAGEAERLRQRWQALEMARLDRLEIDRLDADFCRDIAQRQAGRLPRRAQCLPDLVPVAGHPDPVFAVPQGD